MSAMLLDGAIILALILMNGFFSASEIAIISIKKSRLQALMEEGERRAHLLIDLKENSDSFFATVQIGVTLVGTIASAYGGARMLSHMAPLLQALEVPYIGPYLEQIAFVILVLSLAYLTLVLGELVPKSLALQRSELVALMVVYPLSLFARLFWAFTKLLTWSSNLILKLFKDHTSFSEAHLMQEQEIKHLLQEGVDAGTIDENEHTLIENVFEINDTEAREIMEPRPRMKAVAASSSPEELKRVLDWPFSRLPVYRESLDHIIGILHTRDYMRALARNEKPVLDKLIRPAYFVPESMKIDKILKELQSRRRHVAIVVDEYGVTAGMLTMEDILEEIVGDITDVSEDPQEDNIILKEDYYLVQGTCSVDDFNDFLERSLNLEKLPQIPESESYNSVAGFVIYELGRFPEVGEEVLAAGFSISVTRRVRNQLVQLKVELSSSEQTQEIAEALAETEKSNGNSVG